MGLQYKKAFIHECFHRCWKLDFPFLSLLTQRNETVISCTVFSTRGGVIPFSPCLRSHIFTYVENVLSTVGILDFSYPLSTFWLFWLSTPYYSAQANKKGTIWKPWSWAFRWYLETRPQPQHGLTRGCFPKVIGNLWLGLEQRPLDLWRPTMAQR